MPNRSLNFAVGSSPVATARLGALSYQQNRGADPGPQNYGHVVMSPTIQQHIARAYNALPEHDNSAMPAFHAMREEVSRQFDHLTAPRSHGGMGFTVEATKHDPYPNVMDGGTKDFFNDVGNRHIKVLSSASTGGHPAFSNDDNDMFRAVHDVFGHAGTGRGVDPHGEEAAFQKHASMFSPLARQAMATETRGQNSAMNAAGGVFPVQKVALLPPSMQAISASNPVNSQERAQAMLQAQQFHTRQRL